MRRLRLAIGFLTLGGLALSSNADAGPPRRPTHDEALVRVGKLHDAMTELMAIVRRARGRNAAMDGESVPLDTTTGSTSYGCPTSGTIQVTETAGSTSGGGTASVTITAKTCTTSSSDTLSGSVTYTYSTSGGSGTSPTVTTATYTGGLLKVTGPNAGTYAPAGLAVTTTSSASDGGITTTSTVDGTAVIDGHPIVFQREPLKK